MNMVFRVADHVSLTPTDGGAVLLDAKKSRYWQLNSTGARIVELVEEGKPGSSIARILSDELDAPIARIETDVESLVSSLLKARLIVRRK